MNDKMKIKNSGPAAIIGGCAIDTNLRGDFKHEGFMDNKRAKGFLNKMELLLKEYEISKIDLCWAPPTFPEVPPPADPEA